MAGKLWVRFTDKERLEAISKSRRKTNGSVDFKKMAEVLSDNSHGTLVSQELARYWAMQYDERKKNGTEYLTLTKPNRKLKDKRKLRTPSTCDDKATFCV